MAPDTATLIALVAAMFTLIGAFVSSVFAYYALKKQDERRFRHAEEQQKKIQLKRRIGAYRRLEVIAEIVMSRSEVGESARWLSAQEYETIQSIVAQDFDVLDNSTVAAWDTRGMATSQQQMGTSSVRVVCEAFWQDIKKHYDQVKFSAIPPAT